MARGSRLAVWAGLVALSAALVTLVLALLLPADRAGADRGGRFCAATMPAGHGHKKAHPGHDSCATPSDSEPRRRSVPSPAAHRPAARARASRPPAAPSTFPSVQSVPVSRSNLTLAPSSGPVSRSARPQPTVTVTESAPAPPASMIAEPAAYSPHSSVTLPGTLAAFALAVAGVVAVSGYRRGALLAGRRPGPGGGPRHGRPRGRHNRR